MQKPFSYLYSKTSSFSGMGSAFGGVGFKGREDNDLTLQLKTSPWLCHHHRNYDRDTYVQGKV